jgi:hypothetical protein
MRRPMPSGRLLDRESRSLYTALPRRTLPPLHAGVPVASRARLRALFPLFDIQLVRASQRLLRDLSCFQVS